MELEKWKEGSSVTNGTTLCDFFNFYCEFSLISHVRPNSHALKSPGNIRTNKRHWNGESWGLFVQVAPTLLSPILCLDDFKPRWKKYVIERKQGSIEGLLQSYKYLAKIFVIEVRNGNF